MGADDTVVSRDELRKALAVIPERDKVELLLRVIEGDSYAGAELRSRLRRKSPAPATHRTTAILRMRAQIAISFVDFAAFSFRFDRVRCVSFRPFLVRNWCGETGVLPTYTRWTLRFSRSVGLLREALEAQAA